MIQALISLSLYDKFNVKQFRTIQWGKGELRVKLISYEKQISASSQTERKMIAKKTSFWCLVSARFTILTPNQLSWLNFPN